MTYELKPKAVRPRPGGTFHTYHPFAFTKYAVFMYNNPYKNRHVDSD